MKVKDHMTLDPITAPPEASHREAVDLMRTNGIRHLPIVDKQDRLVGIVVEEDLLSAQPSPATTLSIYEIYSLLEKLKLEQIMSTPVLTVDEDCTISAAARIMIENRIGCLPVMRGDKLVGIITDTDIFKTFVEVLGGGEPGLRVTLCVPDKKGMLAAVAEAFAEAGGDIVSLTTFQPRDSERGQVSIKERGADLGKLRKLLQKLDGVDVLDIRPGGQDKARTYG